MLTEINRYVGVTKFPKHSKSKENLEKDMRNCVCPLLDTQYNWGNKMTSEMVYKRKLRLKSPEWRNWIKLSNPTGHVMHQQFIIQQLYALPTLYLCVLYSSENKQQLVPLTA